MLRTKKTRCLTKPREAASEELSGKEICKARADIRINSLPEKGLNPIGDEERRKQKFP